MGIVENLLLLHVGAAIAVPCFRAADSLHQILCRSRYLNATGLMWESGPAFGAVLVVSILHPPEKGSPMQ